MEINHILGDARTGRPFKIERASRAAEAEYTASLLSKFFHRLGWKRNPSTEPNMREVEVIQAVIILGKPRARGEKVVITELKAAELVAMKVVKPLGVVEVPKLKPWQKNAPKEAEPAPSAEAPASPVPKRPRAAQAAA